MPKRFLYSPIAEDFNYSVMNADEGAGMVTSFTTVGIADTFTIGAWFKMPGTGFIISVDRDVAVRQRATLMYTGSEFRLDVSRDDTPTVGKIYEFDDISLSSGWHHAALVVDDTSTFTVLYIDGDGKFPSNITEHSTVVNQDLQSIISLVGDQDLGWQEPLPWSNNRGPTAIWDEVLLGGALVEIHNPTSGTPFALDLTADSGSYVNSDHLIHWWRPSNFSIGNIDLVGSMDATTDTDTDDIEADAPA